jgi:hypothetical protein
MVLCSQDESSDAKPPIVGERWPGDDMSDIEPELDMPKECDGDDMGMAIGGRFEYVVDTEEGPS